MYPELRPLCMATSTSVASRDKSRTWRRQLLWVRACGAGSWESPSFDWPPLFEQRSVLDFLKPSFGCTNEAVSPVRTDNVEKSAPKLAETNNVPTALFADEGAFVANSPKRTTRRQLTLRMSALSLPRCRCGSCRRRSLACGKTSASLSRHVVVVVLHYPPSFCCAKHKNVLHRAGLLWLLCFIFCCRGCCCAPPKVL